MLKIELQSVKDLDVAGKRVIVRVDFNVPIKNGKVTDDFRIRETLPTLRYLLQKGARLVLVSHLESDGEKPSLKPIVRVLARFLKKPVYFCSDIEITRAKMQKLQAQHKVILLENLRRWKGEEENSLAFAKKLSRWGDVYINEAFSVSHRKHASIVRLSKLLPAAAGFRFLEEVKTLSIDFKKKKPLLFILGGNKFSTKVALIDTFLRVADTIFIAGAIGNAFLAAKGVDIGKSKMKKDQVSKIRKKYGASRKIMLPLDWVEKNGVIYDIGPETITALETKIKRSKFVIWNGPVGFCEKRFFHGTQKIAKMIVKHKKQAIVGGGDTVTALRGWEMHKKFYFTSTGGGAMIDFLAHRTLPGIEALKH